jgi:hypothetical protein
MSLQPTNEGGEGIGVKVRLRVAVFVAQNPRQLQHFCQEMFLF